MSATVVVTNSDGHEAHCRCGWRGTRFPLGQKQLADRDREGHACAWTWENSPELLAECAKLTRTCAELRQSLAKAEERVAQLQFCIERYERQNEKPPEPPKPKTFWKRVFS